MIRVFTLFFIATAHVLSYAGLTFDEREITEEEAKQYLSLKSGKIKTYYRDGRKILTDESLLYGNEDYERTVRIQRVWIDEDYVIQIDTYLDSPIRYTYSKTEFEITDFLTSYADGLMIRSSPKNYKDAFSVGEDQFLTPYSDERWNDWFTPKTFEELKNENQSVLTTPEAAPPAS